MNLIVTTFKVTILMIIRSDYAVTPICENLLCKLINDICGCFHSLLKFGWMVLSKDKISTLANIFFLKCEKFMKKNGTHRYSFMKNSNII